MWMKEKPKSFNKKTCLIIKLEYDVYFITKQVLFLKDFGLSFTLMF